MTTEKGHSVCSLYITGTMPENQMTFVEVESRKENSVVVVITKVAHFS